MKPPYKALTLAIHPNSRGASWIAFENPFSPYDWGTVGTRGREKNARVIAGLEKILLRLSIETIVLEAFERGTSKRRSRVAKLGRAIVALASSRSIDITVYTLGDVRSCFASVGAVTRQDIADATARMLPAISHLVPKRRRPWEGEQWRMSLFAAAALTLTHYQLGASRVFDDLMGG
ncbi:hypothetical protein WG908_03235 [Sphingobium sp. AN641]|uniref:hypothetical protein n=1 Tax=Sphingobium sp. AN641 TaxID=3133443 RepID=UPI0030BC4ACD